MINQNDKKIASEVFDAKNECVKAYSESEGLLKKSFAEYLLQGHRRILGEIQNDLFQAKLLKAVREKYPEYPCHITLFGSCEECLQIYLVPDFKVSEVEEFAEGIVKQLDPTESYFFVCIKNEEVTKEHYMREVERIRKETN